MRRDLVLIWPRPAAGTIPSRRWFWNRLHPRPVGAELFPVRIPCRAPRRGQSMQALAATPVPAATIRSPAHLSIPFSIRFSWRRTRSAPPPAQDAARAEAADGFAPRREAFGLAMLLPNRWQSRARWPGYADPHGAHSPRTRRARGRAASESEAHRNWTVRSGPFTSGASPSRLYDHDRTMRADIALRPALSFVAKASPDPRRTRPSASMPRHLQGRQPGKPRLRMVRRSP